MKTSEIRQRFLSFFEERGHTIVQSSPLVPDDPTLLFTNAGMVRFKDSFLGLETRPYATATSVQKCMRVSGKHNDLENVGPSPRHHTFFEMLGNFSFGDYFKSEAIEYGWAFMTDEMKLPPDRLIVTVFRDDSDAFDLWTQRMGVAPDRVLRMGEKTNFWMMADVGPCGPTTEIHYDFGPEHCTCERPDCSVELDNDCGRWLEVWNIVFMQYDQAEDGSRTPLPKTGVDTGLGLERLAAIKQGVYSNYQTDLFASILDRMQELLGHSDEERSRHRTGYRVLGDHGRAMAFLVADGVLPGNDGRNYVLRLIARRAMRFGKLLGFEEPFLVDLADSVVACMGEAYPELRDKAEWIREVLAEEEARFERTLGTGLDLLDGVIASTREAGTSEIAGDDVFRLYDTFGFPPDLTESVAQEVGLTIDRAGFEREMDAQRERARAGGRFEMEGSQRAYQSMSLPDTEFVGFDQLAADAEVVAIRCDDKVVERAKQGSEIEVVLDRTPFYAEAGGQVADTGVLGAESVVVRVTDTRAPVPGLTVHYGVIEEGSISVHDKVEARVDVDRRLDIMRNHTVTHLLHRSLQEVLGGHAEQRGSLVAPDRMRFDFAHLRGVSREELDDVERRVNGWIRDDAAVSWSHMPLEEARQAGAMMLFGEKYSDTVRMVTVEGVSKELCGGTHLARTGEIGEFVITQESSVGSGLRRIEALTGRGAEEHIRGQLGLLRSLVAQLGTPDADGLTGRVAELQDQVRALTKELGQAHSQLAEAQAAGVGTQVMEIDGVQLVATKVEARDPEALRGQADAFRERMSSGVVVLGAVVEGAPRLVATITDDLVDRGLHAGDLVKATASVIGGGGGGRPTMAEAGGKDVDALDEALAGVSEWVRSRLSAEEGGDDE